MRIQLQATEAFDAFSAGVRVLSQMAGFDAKDIIEAEAATILKTCAARTKVANNEKLVKDACLRALVHLGLTGRPNGSGGNITVNAGIKAPFGRVFARRRPGAGFVRTHDANFVAIRRTSTMLDQTVSEAKAAVARVIPQVRQSAALARGSWVQIAWRMGLDLTRFPGGPISASAINEALNARVKNNVQLRNADFQERNIGRSGYELTLTNRLPYGTKIGMDVILKNVIDGRSKYFINVIDKGFRGSMQEVQKRFRGWTVVAGSGVN